GDLEGRGSPAPPRRTRDRPRGSTAGGGARGCRRAGTAASAAPCRRCTGEVFPRAPGRARLGRWLLCRAVRLRLAGAPAAGQRRVPVRGGVAGGAFGIRVAGALRRIARLARRLEGTARGGGTDRLPAA